MLDQEVIELVVCQCFYVIDVDWCKFWCQFDDDVAVIGFDIECVFWIQVVLGVFWEFIGYNGFLYGDFGCCGNGCFGVGFSFGFVGGFVGVGCSCQGQGQGSRQR